MEGVKAEGRGESTTRRKAPRAVDKRSRANKRFFLIKKILPKAGYTIFYPGRKRKYTVCTEKSLGFLKKPGLGSHIL